MTKGTIQKIDVDIERKWILFMQLADDFYW